MLRPATLWMAAFSRTSVVSPLGPPLIHGDLSQVDGLLGPAARVGDPDDAYHAVDGGFLAPADVGNRQLFVENLELLVAAASRRQLRMGSFALATFHAKIGLLAASLRRLSAASLRRLSAASLSDSRWPCIGDRRRIFGTFLQRNATSTSTHVFPADFLPGTLASEHVFPARDSVAT